MPGTNGLAMCQDCIKLTVDVTDGIQKEGVLHFCRNCERFLQPPSQWLNAAPESRELMALCLRKLKGLQRADRRMIDCSFIWTEPHSRRIKLKIAVQQEAFASTIVQQSFDVEFVVQYQQCPDCAKQYTPNTWRAVVQVRQKVPHKRTFLYLEQLILKHRAHVDTVNVKEVKDGLDFYFASRSAGVKMVEFLSTVAPIRSKKSEELISMDIHTSSKSYKFTYSVEIVPICRDDLVCLPPKLARQMANVSQLTICNRVGNTLHLMDPFTLQTVDLSPNIYWRAPFASLAEAQDLVEFMVLDIEPLGPTYGKYVLAEAQVARMSDMSQNNNTYYIRTHLGAILHPGDTAMGYHLSVSNFNNEIYDNLKQSTLPDVILIKKSYERKKNSKRRDWRLRRMAKEEGGMLPKRQDQEKQERDYELFLRELEEDPEIRQTIDLFKSEASNRARLPRPALMQGLEETSGAVEDVEEIESDDGSLPEIDIGELQDEFEEMEIGA